MVCGDLLLVKERKRRKCGSFPSLSQRRGGASRSNPKDMEMASARGVSVLDRAGNRLDAPFLTGFRHLSCLFSLIYESAP